MVELICDTSVIQYLHQLQILTILHDLSDRVIIPPAVEGELQEGHEAGIDLPVIGETDWIEIECPAGEKDVSPDELTAVYSCDHALKCRHDKKQGEAHGNIFG